MHIDPLVETAIDRGYLRLDGDRVTYYCAQTQEYDYSNPEERVRAFTFSWLIVEKNYPAECLDLEVEVPRRKPSDFADIVVFESAALKTPYLVVENKSPACSGGDWTQAIEQGFGNANSLRDTKYLLVDKYDESILFDVAAFPPTERKENRVGSRDRLPVSYEEAVGFRLVAGGETDIAPSPYKKLENRIRRAHAEIWSGGKRDPLTSFDEWSKLLFAKIHDERHTKKGEPRKFQVGIGESDSQVANRIHELFRRASEEDPTIYRGASINLPPSKVTTVVRILQEESFTGEDLDAIGAAFEQFFGQIFRGQLGQYFTRRELTRYIIGTIEPTADDFILDPTVGSGGFLLESLYQVWHFIDENYIGSEAERVKYDFAHKHLYGIEIQPILARICKTNLLIHKDGHTNIEGDKSALDREFDIGRIALGEFDVVVGNPPFGDTVEKGDRDRLGDSSLSDFRLARGSSVKTEIVIVERAIEFLKPGGRLGFVIPDGLLNNSSPQSNCPQLRRHLLRNGKILAITSLPDHAFTQAGAQNKTSIIFFQKYTAEERARFSENLESELEEREIAAWDDLTDAEKWEVMTAVVSRDDYQAFLAEAEYIGYAPAGHSVAKNDLYSMTDGLPDDDDRSTILGLYSDFRSDPSEFGYVKRPEAMGISAAEMIGARTDGRMDPKYHLFQHQALRTAPAGMDKVRLGDILEERDERVDPSDYPDTEFLVPTLTHDGEMIPREAGKGHNPVSWEGQYFSDGSTWSYVREGDVLFSKIDLWKGAITVVGEGFDGAISTSEFPVYKVARDDLVDPHFLKLLLRTEYFQKAIRAITTGHSNRRRTNKEDFEDLEVFLPKLSVQKRIAEKFAERRDKIRGAETELATLKGQLDEFIEDPTSHPDWLPEKTSVVADEHA